MQACATFIRMVAMARRVLIVCCLLTACRGDVAPAPLEPDAVSVGTDKASSQPMEAQAPELDRTSTGQDPRVLGEPIAASEEPQVEKTHGPLVVFVRATVEEGRESRPAADMLARVQYSVSVAGQKHAGELTGVLDEGGRAELHIEAIPGLDPRVDELQVLASISEPGYCEGQRSLRWKAGRQQLIAKLVTRPGATLHGRVVGVDGQPPVGSCYIALQGTADPNRPSRLRPTRTYAREGKFALDLTHPGTFVLTAYSRGGGSQRISELELDLDALPDDLVVQLEGAGVLSGRVLDPDGSPLPNLILDFIDNGQGGPKRRAPWPSSAVLKAQSGGHHEAWVTTDDQGRFEVTGLKAGLFRIYDREGEEQDLGGRAWPTGSLGIELLVDAYVLSVSVEDAEGEALEAAVSGRGELERPWLQSCAVAGDAPQLHWIQRDGVGIARARPNVVYEISAWGGGYSRAHQQVSLGSKRRRVHLTLALPPKKDPAELILQPLDPGGQALGGRVRARVYAGRPPRALKMLEGQARTAIRASLPPGTYRVVVERPDEIWGRFDLARSRQLAGDGDGDGEEVPALPAPSYGPVVHTLELRPGEAYEHRPRLVGRGWLRVKARLEGRAGPATRVQVQVRRKGPPEPSSQADLSDWRELHFPGAVDSRASLGQAESVRHTSHGSGDERDGLLPNLDQPSGRPLEVGTWEMLVECEGHIPVETTLMITREEETFVEVQLAAGS